MDLLQYVPQQQLQLLLQQQPELEGLDYAYNYLKATTTTATTTATTTTTTTKAAVVTLFYFTALYKKHFLSTYRGVKNEHPCTLLHSSIQWSNS